MEIEKMSIGELVELARKFDVKTDDTAFKVGEQYLIRTVTMYYTGKITRITSKELVLENAAWICDTGRFNDCLKEGKFNEVEPYENDVIIPRDTIVDGTIWSHKLPMKQQ